jgi:hypothetical protein
MTQDELDYIVGRDTGIVKKGEEILITYGEYDDYELFGRYICLITFSVSELRDIMLDLPKGQYPWRENNTGGLYCSGLLTNRDLVGFAIYYGYVRKNEIREIYFGHQYPMNDDD